MTTETRPGSREQRKITDLAREYRQAGYTVILEPSGQDLPDFLEGHRPDLIAIGEEESVVVEVKSRETLPHSDLSDLASKVNRQPGWRLDLVVTNPREKGPPDLEPWSPSTIANALKKFRRLWKDDHTDAAFLLLWATTEAVLRRLAYQEGIGIRRYSPGQIVKQLTIDGALKREYYNPLERAISARNALAHGVGEGHVEPQLVEQLSGITEQLSGELARPSKGHPPA